MPSARRSGLQILVPPDSWKVPIRRGRCCFSLPIAPGWPVVLAADDEVIMICVADKVVLVARSEAAFAEVEVGLRSAKNEGCVALITLEAQTSAGTPE